MTRCTRRKRSLQAFMTNRWWAFPIMLISVVIIYLVYNQLPSELSPLEDRNTFRMFATGPEGVTFEYMDQYVNEVITTTMDEIPERDFIGTVTSPNFGASSSVNSAFLFAMLYL